MSCFNFYSLKAKREPIGGNQTIFTEGSTSTGNVLTPYDVFNNDNAEFDIASQEAPLNPEPLAENLARASHDNAVVFHGTDFSVDGVNLDTIEDPINYAQEAMIFGWGNLTGKFQIKFKPESFIARNANLLNNANRADFV